MRQYSADQIEVTWAILNAIPLDMKEGLARGTFIQPTRNASTWTQKDNGVGGILRMFNPSRSGFLTFLIPLLNFFCLPALVVGGTLLFLHVEGTTV